MSLIQIILSYLYPTNTPTKEKETNKARKAEAKNNKKSVEI